MSDSLSTGCDSLNTLLNGGVDRGAVTELYGSPGTGKTNIALNTTVETAAHGEDVVYIDTEGVSDARLTTLMDAHPVDGDSIAENIYRKDAMNFEEQRKAVKAVDGISDNLGLVVLDSATGFYRLKRTRDESEAETLRELADQIVYLLGIARRSDAAVIFTNQVYADIEEDASGVSPLGGNTLNHWPSTILYIEDTTGARQVHLEKHRAKETGMSKAFTITDSGLRGTPTP
ncbi:DNA repair and recombination protein RadB [Salinibaculum rarum]|uniref:DNA repair and recombination protein RadB n=1 Tax=Salinibaculum rarum TaxID=3058903 RepID=UPI00265E87C9|nr:DNA repair and recombination protein RadB [Salinibaculum sp. KK48]